MSFSLRRCLVWSRLAQAYIDALLYLVVLGSGMYAMAWNGASEHKKQVQQHAARLAIQTAKTPQNKVATHALPVQWSNPLEATSNPWGAFDTWRVQQGISEGHCSMRFDQVTCLGIKGSASTQLAAVAFEPFVLLKPTTSSKVQHNAPTETTEHLRKEGWIQTPKGKRHFNTTTQRWAP
jgi:hypothetical protein